MSVFSGAKVQQAVEDLVGHDERLAIGRFRAAKL